MSYRFTISRRDVTSYWPLAANRKSVTPLRGFLQPLGLLQHYNTVEHTSFGRWRMTRNVGFSLSIAYRAPRPLVATAATFSLTYSSYTLEIAVQ